MADLDRIKVALSRGYTLDEIADIETRAAGHDPALVRERGYSTDEMMQKLGVDPMLFKQPEDPAQSDDSGDMSRGFTTAFKQVPQLGYGLVAGVGAVGEAVFGEGGASTGLKEYGVRKYQEASADIAKDSRQTDSLTYSWEQAKQGDIGALADWLQYGVGYGGAQAIQALATFGAGGLVGKAALKGSVDKLASGMVAKEAARIAATTEGKKLASDALQRMAVANVATKIGQTAGVGAQAFGMEGGEIFGGLAEQSVNEGRTLGGDEIAKAFGATLAAGGLEFVTDKMGVDLVLGKSSFVKGAADIPGFKGKAARAGLGMATQMPAEAGTEYLQTGLEAFGQGDEANPLTPFQSAESRQHAIDAAGLGAVGGGVPAVAGGFLSSPNKANPAPVVPPANPNPPSGGDITAADILALESQQAANAIPQATTVDEALSAFTASNAAANKSAASVGFTQAFANLSGGGTTADLYRKVFDSLAAGKNTVSGVKDPILARAKLAFDAGLIKSPDDIRVFEQSGYPLTPIADINSLDVPITGYTPPPVLTPEQRNQQTIDRAFAPSLAPAPLAEGNQAVIDALDETQGYAPLTLEQKNQRVIERMRLAEQRNRSQPTESNPSVADVTENVAPVVEPARATNPVVESGTAVEATQAVAPVREPRMVDHERNNLAQRVGDITRITESDLNDPDLAGEVTAPDVVRGITMLANDSGIPPAQLRQEVHKAWRNSENPVLRGMANDILRDQPAPVQNETKSQVSSTPDNVNLSATPDNVPNPGTSVPNTGIIARVGTTPNSTEPVTVRNGVVYLGDYPAQDFNSGEDITVPEGSGFEQVSLALRKGGALSSKQRIYAGEKGVVTVTTLKEKKSRTTPLTDPRLADPVYQESLPRYAQGAGWAEEGGKLIRDANGDAAGRTSWVPKADWWVGKPDGVTEKVIKSAVPKAIAGQNMPVAEKNAVMWLLDVIEADLAAQVSDEGNAVAEDLADVADDIPGFDDAAPMDAAEAMRRSGLFTEEEIHAETQGNTEAAGEVAKSGAEEGNRTGEDQAQEGASGGEETAGLTELQAAYDQAKTALDAIGDEPPNVNERRFFGANGRDAATPDARLKFDEMTKRYAKWRRQYSKLKKAEVDASNALFHAKQKAKDAFALNQQTPAELEAKDKAAKRAEERARIEASKPTGPDVTADQVDMFNTQEGLFASNREQPKPARGEIGTSLSKEERKTVLASLVDVYKSKGAEKETRINRNGDEYLAYPHQPELFEKSDITGAMVRYYVTLPDGRIAHPTELFPDYTQSDIDAELQRQRAEENRITEFAKQVDREARLAGFETPEDDNRYWQEKSDESKKMTAHGGWSIAPPSERIMFTFTRDGKFHYYYSVYKDDAGKITALRSKGWDEVKANPVQQPAPFTEPEQPVEANKQSAITAIKQSDLSTSEKLSTIAAVNKGDIAPEDVREVVGKVEPEAAVAEQEAEVEPITAAERQDIAESAIEQADAIEPADNTLELEPVSKDDALKAQGQEAKIGDFGRKVIVRKDMAQPTGKRGTKTADERPAWMRPYHAMQIQQTPGRPANPNVGRWEIMKESGGMKGSVNRVGRNTFATEQEAIDAIPLAEVSRNHRVYSYAGKEASVAQAMAEAIGKAPAMQYGIYRIMADGKKRALVKGGFASQDEAMKYMASNPVEIIEHKFQFPERPWLDRIERTGPERRTGDVTKAMFEQTFAPGGVVYGNWLLNSDGTVNADGQALSNHAYDALMDLADTIGVPPKALFLNGDMVLGLGADGKGGKGAAAAHYSPGKVLINLTKIKGAGSAAHEWWHAVDHYFARNGGKAESHSVVADDFGYKSTARPELMQAIKRVVDTMLYAEKSKTTDADVVRNNAAKREAEAQRNLDYYMADLNNNLTDGRYNKGKKTATPEQMKQWNAMLARLKAGDMGEQVYIENPSKSRYAMGFQTGEVLRDMNALYKSVAGRSFLRQDQESVGRRMHWIVKAIQENREKINAKEDETRTYKGRTDYYLEAKEIDGYRAGDYWSTPEEMGARAFESYIFDKLIGDQKRSDYLVYAVENRYYAMLGMKPYPEGDERKAINAAFDNLFATIQTKQTDTGTAMFSRRIHGDRPTAHDYIVPETPEFDGNMSGDLAYTPQSAEEKGIEQLPIRLTVGQAREAHRGFGINKLKAEADSNPNREPPQATNDRAENFARQVALIARSFNQIYTEGGKVILRNSNLKQAIVVERRWNEGESFYSVVSLRPADKVVWGLPDWTERSRVQSDRLRKPSVPEPSPDRESPQSDRQFLGKQSSKFDFTEENPDRQPPNNTTVTYKKRRAFTVKDADFLRSDYTDSTQPEQANDGRTDATAGRDIQILEAVIERELGGSVSARGAFRAARLPEHDVLAAIARAWGANIRGVEVTGDRRKFGFFNGVYISGNSETVDTIYLNETVQRPHLNILGHELVHRLRNTNPELYRKFVEAVKLHIAPERYRVWSRMFPETGEKLLEEFMAEVVSDGFMNKDFWQAVANRNKGMFRSIQIQLAKLVDQILNTVGYTPKTKAVLNDYARVMQIAGTVMGEHGISQQELFRMAGVSEATYHRVFHGTPHLFKPEPGFPHGRFHLDYIGTGEGAQAYGFGIYFAESRGVADGYRKNLSRTTSVEVAGENAVEPSAFKSLINKPLSKRNLNRFAATVFSNFRDYKGGEPERNASSMIAAARAWFGTRFPLEVEDQLYDFAQTLNDSVVKEQRGQLYHLDIPDSVLPNLLDWDKPLSEQTAEVRAALAKVGDRFGSRIAKAMQSGSGAESGKNFYDDVVRMTHGPKAASEYLASIGIVGNKYLDGNSRTTTGGEIVSITKTASGWVAKVKVTNRGGVGFAAPTDMFTTGKPYATEAEARAWAEEKISEGTHNFVIWDQPTLDKIALLERNGEKLDALGDAAFSRKTEGFDVKPNSKSETLIYKLQDKHIDLKRILQGIRAAGGVVTDKFDAYMQEALYHGRAAKRTEDFLNDEMQPLVHQMQKDGIGMDELNEYLHARHAIERNAVMLERNPDREGNDWLSGMKNDKAKAILENASPAIQAAAAKVDSIISNTRQMMVDYGLEKQETVDAWAKQYKSYVPLMREGFDTMTGIGQGFSVRGSSTKEATGSHRAVEEILAHVAMQREKIITRGEKNRVSMALYGLAMLNPNKAIWSLDKPAAITYVNPNTGLTESVPGDVADYKVPMIRFVGPDGTVQERPDPTYKGRDNVVALRVNGEDRAIIFNENDERALRLAQSMKNLDLDSMGLVMGSVGSVTRYISSVNTQYNPVFGIINGIRDVQTAAINLSSTEIAGKQKDVMRGTLRALKGIYSDARAVRRGEAPRSDYAQLWEEFQGTGGQTGYRDMFATGKERAEAIQHMLDPEWWQKTKLGKFATAGGLLAKPEQFILDARWGGKRVFNWLSDYNTAMENAVRLSAYKVAIEQGISKERAAFIAKNLTVNFNKKGASSQQLGALYAFFNASVQGTARIAETLTNGAEDGEVLGKVGKQIVYGGIVLGAMQAVALAMAGFDEDEPPEFVRERALIIPTGGKTYVSIPMPLGFHLLPNIGRQVMETVFYGKPIDRMMNLLLSTAGGLNPVGSGASILQTITPTVVDPIAALSENKDWTGKAIYREDFSSLNPTPGYTRGKDSASIIAYGLSYGMNLITGGSDYQPGKISPTPDQIDYLIGQATGGVGREAVKAFSVADSLMNDKELPTYKIPLAGRLVGSSGGTAGVRDKFYNNVRLMNQHQSEIEGRREHGEPVQDYMKSNPEARLYREAGSFESQLRKLKKQRDAARDKDQKERAKLLDQRMNALMNRFNERVEKAGG